MSETPIFAIHSLHSEWLVVPISENFDPNTFLLIFLSTPTSPFRLMLASLLKTLLLLITNHLMICKIPFNKEMQVPRLSFLEVCRPARTKSAGPQVCHHDGSIFWQQSMDHLAEHYNTLQWIFAHRHKLWVDSMCGQLSDFQTMHCNGLHLL